MAQNNNAADDETRYYFTNPMQPKKHFVLFLILIIGAAVVLPVRSLHAQQISGELQVMQGKRVLRLWGSHYDMGYAHGYLLAEEIVALLEGYMLGMLYDVENYWRTLLLVETGVKMPAAYRREIRGMHQGMLDALGEDGLYSELLQREFGPADLIAWNMAPEIFRLSFSDIERADEPRYSSSIAGWGDKTADGSLIIARDLDFGAPGDLLDRSSLLIAYQPRRFVENSWLAVSWPGVIGCLTGMSEQGAGAALDLGNYEPDLDDLLLELDGTYVPPPFYYTPITLALRLGLERRSLRFPDPIDNVVRIISRIHIAGSFDIHLFSAAGSDGPDSVTPASIIECSHQGAMLRTPADNQNYEPKLLSDSFLAVTNHHRKLQPPVECPRYTHQVQRLNSLDVLDMDTALDIEREISQDQPPFNTVHLVGFIPDRLQLWVSFADGELSAVEADPAEFAWQDIFTR